MNRTLDLISLRTLIAVGETGGMTRAANLLHMTQSAVSMQMKRMEDQLSVSLLTREGRKVVPTVEGDQLIAYGKRLLEINDEAIRNITVPSYDVTISCGIPGDIVHPFLPKIFDRLKQQQPRYIVNIKSGFTYYLLRELKDGLHDVILTTERNPSEGGIVLARKSLVWMGKPSGESWKKRPVPLSLSYRCMFRQPAMNALDNAGIDWLDVTQAMNDESALLCAAADMGIRAELACSSYLGLCEIDHHGELPELPEYSIVMYFSPGLHKDIAEEFGSVVKSIFNETVA